jgi:plasmid stability protein
MSDSAIPTSTLEHFHLENLPEDALTELSERAQRNGRTIHEEAEHAIKQHLAASDGNDG